MAIAIFQTSMTNADIPVAEAIYDPLDMKQFTVEELYEKLDHDITEKLKIQKPTPEDCAQIIGYLSELYLRGIHIHSTNPDLMNRATINHIPKTYQDYERPQVELEWWDYDVVKCYNYKCKKVMESDEIRYNLGKKYSYIGYCLHCIDHGYTSGIGYPPVRCTKEESIECHHQSIVYQLGRVLQVIKSSVDKTRSTIKKIKAIQLGFVKKTCVYEEINELMDSILDSNGNKISEFKEYLSPEHYRLLRAGRDVSEFKEQDELLSCLKRMKSQIKK